jgi:hypothetical protein
VQHVVTPKAAAGETLRGLPELGRCVLEDPRRDDLMQCEMQLSVDRLASDLDLGRPVLDRLPEPRVLRRDQQPPIILVAGVKKRDIDAVEKARSAPSGWPPEPERYRAVGPWRYPAEGAPGSGKPGWSFRPGRQRMTRRYRANRALPKLAAASPTAGWCPSVLGRMVVVLLGSFAAIRSV